MIEIKMARSLGTVHTHTHTPDFYKIDRQSEESYSLVNKNIKIKRMDYL